MTTLTEIYRMITDIRMQTGSQPPFIVLRPDQWRDIRMEANSAVAISFGRGGIDDRLFGIPVMLTGGSPDTSDEWF